MRAILINERQDKPGLIGRPVVTQSGLISALKGTHQAGQRVTLMNMRSIKDKLAKVQLALDGANQNLLEIGNNLETFDKNLENLKEATSRLGDYWTQFLNQPTVTDFSLIRFLDVGGAMDKSRQDMMGEYVDPYFIEPNLLLPRGGIHTPTPGMDTMINGEMSNYWGYFEPQPWIDRFGVRLPDGGFYADTFVYDPNHGPGSIITPEEYPPSGKLFYGPLRRGPYINGYSLLQAVEADAYGACFCPKNIGLRTGVIPYNGANYGWHPEKMIRLADEDVEVWISAPFFPAENGVAIEGPCGNIPLASFSARDGHWYYGRCYQATVHVHFNEALLVPDEYIPSIPMIPNYQKTNQSYMALNAIEYIDVNFIDDEVGEDTYLVNQGVPPQEYVNMLQHRRFYLNTDSGRWVTRNGQGSLVAGQHQTIFPCVGFNVTDVGDSAGHVEDPFDRGYQSLYAACRDTLPRQRIDTVPKYFVEVSTYRWNGNLLDVPPRKIGGRQIVSTHVLHTSCRFGYSPYYIGPVEAPNIKPTPKGTYDSVQVLGRCSDGLMILITERIRIKYDDTTVSVEGPAAIESRPSAVRTIENVFYGFDPNKDQGDIFDRECIGLLQQVIVTTWDGHQIVYRDNAKWRDVYDPYAVPRLWEFRYVYDFNPFYPRY